METRTPLFTGFGKVDYTPNFPVGLAGYGSDFSRRNTEIVAHVYVTCIAARQDDTTILLYTVDTCGLRLRQVQRFREAVKAATGVPVEHMFFGATHSHNCPSLVPESEPTVAKTLELMEAAAVEAAKIALDDLAESKLLAAKPLIPDMNYTRHYRLAGGRRASVNAGMMKKDDPIVGHLGPNDPNMVLVKFAREGKQDIVLMNWQAHPDDAQEIGFSSIAAGFVGPARDELEALSGCKVAYFNGCSGNQVRRSWLPAPNNDLAYDVYGKQLAQMAFAAFEQLQPLDSDGIQAARTMLPVTVNHTEDYKLEQAMEIGEVNAADGRLAARELCKRYGFATIAHAAGVRMRATLKQTDELELSAFRIGPVGFANNTCETFSDQGLHIKANSPYEYTMIITGNRSYLAAKRAFDYCSYEAVGGSGYYERGTAEEMADKLLDLLAELE